VGNGNIDVGNEKLRRKPGQPAVDALGDNPSNKPRTDKQNVPATERPRISAAMAQQCGDMGRGNQSAPQIRAIGGLPRSQSSAGAASPPDPRAALICSSGFRIRSLDELAAFLNGGIAAAPGHDWYRGGRILR
jgi:hypothetical protein